MGRYVKPRTFVGQGGLFSLGRIIDLNKLPSLRSLPDLGRLVNLRRLNDLAGFIDMSKFFNLRTNSSGNRRSTKDIFSATLQFLCGRSWFYRSSLYNR
jgi:hypothetical protein